MVGTNTFDFLQPGLPEYGNDSLHNASELFLFPIPPEFESFSDKRPSSDGSIWSEIIRCESQFNATLPSAEPEFNAEVKPGDVLSGLQVQRTQGNTKSGRVKKIRSRSKRKSANKSSESKGTEKFDMLVRVSEFGEKRIQILNDLRCAVSRLRIGTETSRSVLNLCTKYAEYCKQNMRDTLYLGKLTELERLIREKKKARKLSIRSKIESRVSRENQRALDFVKTFAINCMELRVPGGSGGSPPPSPPPPPPHPSNFPPNPPDDDTPGYPPQGPSGGPSRRPFDTSSETSPSSSNSSTQSTSFNGSVSSTSPTLSSRSSSVFSSHSPPVFESYVSQPLDMGMSALLLPTAVATDSNIEDTKHPIVCPVVHHRQSTEIQVSSPLEKIWPASKSVKNRAWQFGRTGLKGLIICLVLVVFSTCFMDPLSKSRNTFFRAYKRESFRFNDKAMVTSEYSVRPDRLHTFGAVKSAASENILLNLARQPLHSNLTYRMWNTAHERMSDIENHDKSTRILEHVTNALSSRSIRDAFFTLIMLFVMWNAVGDLLIASVFRRSSSAQVIFDYWRKHLRGSILWRYLRRSFFVVMLCYELSVVAFFILSSPVKHTNTPDRVFENFGVPEVNELLNVHFRNRKPALASGLWTPEQLMKFERRTRDRLMMMNQTNPQLKKCGSVHEAFDVPLGALSGLMWPRHENDSLCTQDIDMSNNVTLHSRSSEGEFSLDCFEGRIHWNEFASIIVLAFISILLVASWIRRRSSMQSNVLDHWRNNGYWEISLKVVFFMVLLIYEVSVVSCLYGCNRSYDSWPMTLVCLWLLSSILLVFVWRYNCIRASRAYSTHRSCEESYLLLFLWRYSKIVIQDQRFRKIFPSLEEPKIHAEVKEDEEDEDGARKNQDGPGSTVESESRDAFLTERAKESKRQELKHEHCMTRIDTSQFDSDPEET